MKIREATLEDLPAIVKVQRETWSSTYPNADYGILLEDIEAINFEAKRVLWQHMILSPSYDLWVAVADEPIGFLALQTEGAVAEVHSLYVLPAHQRLGIGSQLLNTALEKVGLDRTVVLSSAVYNGIAVDFYKQFGFKVDKNEPMGDLNLDNGKSIPTIIMVRPAETADAEEQMNVSRDVKAEPVEEPAPMPAKVVTNKLLTRIELARLSGLRPSTIKYYTELGILPFDQVADGLRRYYNRESSLMRLQQIKELKAEGLGMAEIKSRLS